MKNLIWLSTILFGLLIVSDTVVAQNRANSFDSKKTVFTVRPVSLLFQQPNIRFEHAFSRTASAGASLSYFTGLNDGLKVEPFARFYTSARSGAPEGFYFQAKALVGNHKKELEDLEGDILDTDSAERFTALGAGFGVGNQWLVGAGNNIVLDLYSGLKRYKPLGTDLSGDRFLFSTTRSFPLELRFSVGIAF